MDPLVKMYNYINSTPEAKVLFLTTSNRWEGEKTPPRSSQLAASLKDRINDCEIIDVSKLKIFPCEGNVSIPAGNSCGVLKAALKDKDKNPTGNIRCWASINNPTDEMHIVANAILESDIIVFFGSVRWGKMNAIYTHLVERLTWLENRHRTLGESNLLAEKKVGVVAIGHNWNSKESVALEKEVFEYFGFKTPSELSFNWQWTQDSSDESQRGYKADYAGFLRKFKLVEIVKKSMLKFKEWLANK
jgi:multimeric flavodoxin WrbA